MCEYLQSRILKAVNTTLPSSTVGNNYTPKSLLDILSNISKSLRKLHLLQEKEFQDSSIRAHLDDKNNNFETDLSSFIDSALSRTRRCITLDRVFIDHPTQPQLLTDPKNIDDAVINHFQNFVPIKSTPPMSIETLPDRCIYFIPTLPFSLSSCQQDNFKSLLDNLSDISKSLRGLHLLQEKEFQDSSIHAHLDDRNNNFETDLSSFIDSALSRTRRRITLDRVFIDHPTHPQLLTDPKDIDDAIVNHFQNFVPIKSTPPVSINTFPDRWSSAYQPMDNVSSSIYDSLMIPPTLDEWFSTVSSTPNGKASGPSMITYEMLKHLGTRISALLLILIQACLSKADIPDLWRQAM
ncbi:hypothetical protein RhiirA5_434235, partial [Rhizophagus irregularis]